MKQTVLKWATKPFISCADGDSQFLLDYRNDMMQMHAAPVEMGLRPVEYAKRTLGRQDYTWVGSEFRFWVWERDKWRLFVNNRYGITLEVDAGLTKNQALDVWKFFLKAFLPV